MASSSMTVYWASGSPPCWRVFIALEEKALQGYQSKILSFEKQENKSPEILALNPRGQIPIFTHGDLVISESLAVCEYLECAFKNQGTKLIPDDLLELALVRQRTFEALLNLERIASNDLLYHLMFASAALSADEIKERKKKLREELDRWEGYLAKFGKGGHIANKDFTMADVLMFPGLAFMVRMGLPVKSWPHIDDYYKRLTARPSIAATWPPHWKDSEGKALLADV